MTFNAYEHWVGSLGQLYEMLRRLHDEYDATRLIAPDLGADLLRAWPFVLVRQSRFVGAVNKDDFIVDDYRSPAIEATLTRLMELAPQACMSHPHATIQLAHEGARKPPG